MFGAPQPKISKAEAIKVRESCVSQALTFLGVVATLRFVVPAVFKRMAN